MHAISINCHLSIEMGCTLRLCAMDYWATASEERQMKEGIQAWRERRGILGAGVLPSTLSTFFLDPLPSFFLFLLFLSLSLFFTHQSLIASFILCIFCCLSIPHCPVFVPPSPFRLASFASSSPLNRRRTSPKGVHSLVQLSNLTTSPVAVPPVEPPPSVFL